MKKNLMLFAEWLMILAFSVIMTLIVMIAVFGLDQLERTFESYKIFIS